MAALDRTQLLKILKEMYPAGMSDETVVKGHPTLTMIKRDKNPKFGGRYIHIPIQYGKTGGRSHTFSSAQANVVASKYDAWDVTIVSNYAVGTISGLAVDLAKGDQKEIFVDALMKEMDGSLESLGDDIARELFRNGGGARGQRGSVSGSVVTLTNKEDIWFFEVGMVIKAATTDGTSGSLRAGSHTVTAIDEDAGTYTFSGTITSFADNDYLFVDGDFGAAATGLDGWCPATAPTGGDNFFGMDRSTSPSRLAGIRFDASALGYTLEESFIRVKARERRAYAKTKYWVVNPRDLASTEVSLSGVRRIVDDNDYNIGLEVIDAYGVTLMPDPDCQPGVAWGLAEGALEFLSLGDCPRLIEEDGLEMIRSATADDYEFRATGRYQFASPKPFAITRMKLPT